MRRTRRGGCAHRGTPLGNPPARGGTGILPAPISAAAGTPAREIERQRKEKQRQCDNRLDALRTIRHGTAVTRIAEGHSVPEGQAKSEQAPVRRPPSARRHGRAGARLSALFFWTVHGPFSFPQDGKENGGCIPAGQAPLAGARPPRPPQRRPMRLRGRLPQCRKIQSRWSLRPSR